MADVVANGVRHHVISLGPGLGAGQRVGGPGFSPPNGDVGERAVVFVHGLVMDNLSSFYFTLANPLAERARVVLYDLRGHGMSERPARGYAVADFVADLAALTADLPPFALVGNSFGGLVALAFAAAHPARVSRLALIDAHTGAGDWAAQMTATLALQGDARDRKIAESFQSWLGRHSERKRTRLADSAKALVEGTSLVADLRRSPALALGGIACPVLALYGETSDVRAHGEALAAELPACTLELFPGCSHSVLWEATAAVRDRVVAFVTAGASPR